MMVKKITTLNIDAEVVKNAKERFINLSKAAEDGIKKQLGVKEVDTEISECEFCGRSEEKAFVDYKTGSFHDGLTWLGSDERWICSTCSHKKSMSMTKYAQ